MLPVKQDLFSTHKRKKPAEKFSAGFYFNYFPLAVGTTKSSYSAWLTATAQATVAPTIGLLPIPIRPIIST